MNKSVSHFLVRWEISSILSGIIKQLVPVRLALNTPMLKLYAVYSTVSQDRNKNILETLPSKWL